MLCFSKEALSFPLTTLPSQALQTEAVKLFKVPRIKNVVTECFFYQITNYIKNIFSLLNSLHHRLSDLSALH